jgi:hypothetical protein
MDEKRGLADQSTRDRLAGFLAGFFEFASR